MSAFDAAWAGEGVSLVRTVHLHGRLAKLFGKVHRFETATAGEVFRALHCNFGAELIEALKIGAYKIIRGDKHAGMHLGESDLNSLNLGHADLHVVPVVAGSKGGSKKGGSLKAILGVVIIGAAIFLSGGTLAAPLAGLSGASGVLGLTWGNIAGFGLAMTLMGVSQMISPKAKKEDQTKKDDQSHAFSGPLNNNEQGQAIPLIYGFDVIVGGAPISTSIDVMDIPPA